MTSMVSHLFGGMNNLITFAEGMATLALISLLIVSFLHVIFGEMVPKNLSFST